MVHKKLHYIYFDGTSAWVDEEGFEDEDTIVLDKSTDLDWACDYADNYNKMINSNYGGSPEA